MLRPPCAQLTTSGNKQLIRFFSPFKEVVPGDQLVVSAVYRAEDGEYQFDYTWKEQ